MAHASKSVNDIVVSHFRLRSLLGIIGVALPFVVVLAQMVLSGEWTGLQRTISDYYHTEARDFFVGMLWAMGVFLLTYKGHIHEDNSIQDDGVTNVAGLLAILVAMFPTADGTQIGRIHLTAAALFFLTMAYLCYYSFTLVDESHVPTGMLKRYIQIYTCCGIVIFACIALLVAYSFLPANLTDGIENSCGICKPFFFLEAIAIIFFGIAWLTKGAEIEEGVSSVVGRAIARMVAPQDSGDRLA